MLIFSAINSLRIPHHSLLLSRCNDSTFHRFNPARVQFATGRPSRGKLSTSNSIKVRGDNGALRSGSAILLLKLCWGARTASSAIKRIRRGERAHYCALAIVNLLGPQDLTDVTIYDSTIHVATAIWCGGFRGSSFRS